MKKLLVISALHCLIFNLFSQAPNWAWAISSGGVGDELIYDMTIDNENNSIVIGQYIYNDITFCSETLKSYRPIASFISKIDNAGNCIWSKNLGGEYGETQELVITSDMDNNIYIAASFQGNFKIDTVTLQYDSIGLHILIAKLNPSNELQWVKAIDGNALNGIIKAKICTSLKYSNEGSLYLLGFMDSKKLEIDTVNLINEQDGGNSIFLLKFDLGGHALWGKLFKGIGVHRAVNLAIDSDNNVVICGYFNGFGIDFSYILFDSIRLNNNSYSITNIFVTKLDPSGKVIWANSYGKKNSCISGIVCTDSHNNIYITGTYKNRFEFGADTLISINQDYNNFLLKFDQNGNPIWALSNYYGSYFELYYPMTIDRHDNIYIQQLFSDPVIKVNNQLFYCKGGSEIILSKITPDKSYVWSISYGCDDYDKSDLFGVNHDNEVISTGYYAGKYIIFGRDTFINEGYKNGSGSKGNVFIAKLKMDTITSSVDPYNNMGLNLYPNPVSKNLHVNCNSIIGGPINIVIYNISGLETKGEYHFTNPNFNIDMGKFSSGIYILQMSAKEGVFRRKFVVQH